MRTLWFKGCYVGPILCGEKVDTIRPAANLKRLPRAGETVALTVGPRPAFATAEVLSVEPVTAADLESERRVAVERCCGAGQSDLVRVTFRLLTTPATATGPA